jgi:hypothetical protein
MNSREKNWIPDLVADCWRALKRDGSWRHAFSGSPPGDTGLLGEEGVRWRDLARRGAGVAPRELLEAFEMVSGVGDRSRRATMMLRLLVALDRAGDGLGFRRPTAGPAIDPILRQWERKGELTRNSGDHLVLRKAGSGLPGGASLDHYLHNYTVVERGHHGIRIHTLTGGVSFRDLNRTHIKVAFVPILDHQDDAKFVAGRTPGRFLVALDPAKQRDLEARAQALVQQLETAGVNLAILPETCISDRLAAALAKALEINFARYEAKLPSLRLVIAGIGTVAQPSVGQGVYNDVRVFTGDGKEVCRQTKLNPWCLDEWQRKRYALDAEHETEDIDLEAPAVIQVLEDEVLGRLVVLICEDLKRIDPARSLIPQLCPSVVVGPVMDDSLEERSWGFLAAQQLAVNEPRSLVLVANSCWLTMLSGARGRRHSSRPPRSKAVASPGIGIVHTDREGQVVRSTSEPFRVSAINVEETMKLARHL